jgi:hypothetical protein
MGSRGRCSASAILVFLAYRYVAWIMVTQGVQPVTRVLAVESKFAALKHRIEKKRNPMAELIKRLLSSERTTKNRVLKITRTLRQLVTIYIKKTCSYPIDLDAQHETINLINYLFAFHLLLKIISYLSEGLLSNVSSPRSEVCLYSVSAF